MSPNIASFCMNSEIKINYNLDVDGSAGILASGQHSQFTQFSLILPEN